MENFVYNIPTKVFFGKNQLENLPKALAPYGKRVLMTYGGGSIKKIGLYDGIMKVLGENDFTVFELGGIEPNPRIESVRAGAHMCKEHNIDVLLAVGGGSTIDATKFMAAGALDTVDPWDYFTKRAPITKALPIVSVLTLSATGSEMDAGGVVSNLKTNEKLGRMSHHLVPKVSFLDPTATFTVNPFQTACGSVDIMSHILEQYFVAESMYMTDTIMEGLLKTVVKYAPIALEDGENYEARANLMWASSWAINGFISCGSKLAPWSCHPIEHELSAFYDITHGLGLAIVTPRWMEYVLDEENANRFARLGREVFGVNSVGTDMEVAKETITKVYDFFFNTLKLTSNLKDLGIDETHIETMAQKACNNKAIYGYKTLTKEDIAQILRMCL